MKPGDIFAVDLKPHVATLCDLMGNAVEHEPAITYLAKRYRPLHRETDREWQYMTFYELLILEGWTPPNVDNAC